MCLIIKVKNLIQKKILLDLENRGLYVEDTFCSQIFVVGYCMWMELYKIFKGIHLGGRQLSETFIKGSTLEGENFSLGSKSFLSRVDHFLKWLDLHKSQQTVAKVVSHVKIAEKSTKQVYALL